MGTPWGLPAIDRFSMKVEKTGTCWLWRAAKSSNGYGMFAIATNKATTAHRWSYTHFVGPIPRGHQIDHLCGVHECVNPAHLEAVTPSENTLRDRATRRRARARRDFLNSITTMRDARILLAGSPS